MLDIRGVAAILGVRPKTVSQYLTESKGEGRYAGHPFPSPNGYIGKSPWWMRRRVAEIRKWAQRRPGQGAGGGRPRKSTNPSG